jgi:hypothetical protein
MKESLVMKDLESLAEGLEIAVNSVNLRKYSYGIKSGLCRVNGDYRVILDKHLHLSEKIDVLVDALQEMEISTDDLDPHLQRLLRKRTAASYQTSIEDISAAAQSIPAGG